MPTFPVSFTIFKLVGTHSQYRVNKIHLRDFNFIVPLADSVSFTAPV